MDSFKNQIEEDIKVYQKEFPKMDKIKKDEWAFNFWILDKFFYEDEELIEDKIIDYHDLGIDCYQCYEDTKEVYLIQNKYYSDSNKLNVSYIKDDFLVRGITSLEHGDYSHCDELQNFYNKYKNDEDFVVHMHLYITNNSIINGAEDIINKFNKEHPNYRAKIFYLNDIENKYWGETKENKVELKSKIYTVNKATVLNIDNESYKLANILDARYVFAPVSTVYKLYKDAKSKNYPIFDKNIREYLGNKGINGKIYKTLLDPVDRKNFFYYNNGITIICDNYSSLNTISGAENNLNTVFEITNPQIVNGCQTVNSIYSALDTFKDDVVDSEFKDTFVMLKILQIDSRSKEHGQLYESIVRYNNSQNAINDNAFAANAAVFSRLKDEFSNYGFLLLVKQSDKNIYKDKYKNITKLKEKSGNLLDKFGISVKRVDDFFIPLDKLMQVINAFIDNGHTAYVKKSMMLKFESKQYETGINFIKNNKISTILDLYLLYKRAELEKKASSDSRSPISYYLIDGFALYECNERKPDMISKELSNQASINNIVKLYQLVSVTYSEQYYNINKIDYNKMIKQPIDRELFTSQRKAFKSVVK